MVSVTHTGNVKDENGIPLPGAHVVLVDNNTVGTITNENGSFIINGFEGQTFEIGHIGKSSTSVTLNRLIPAADYTLVDNAFELNEVVIGASTKKLWLTILGYASAFFIARKIFK